VEAKENQGMRPERRKPFSSSCEFDFFARQPFSSSGEFDFFASDLLQYLTWMLVRFILCTIIYNAEW
jgi:hypothetical protein